MSEKPTFWQKLTGRGAVRADSSQKQLSGEVASRDDGWTSVLGGGGFGDTSRDKRTSLRFRPILLDRLTVENLWRSNDLATTIIEELPKDMFRRGYELSIGDDPELEKDITSQAEELCIRYAFRRGKMFDRAYGGGAIFPIMQDQQGDFSKPLQENRIVRVERVHVFDVDEMKPSGKYFSDPTEKDFGKPSSYILYPRTRGGGRASSFNGVEIHASRLIVFEGVRVSRSQVSANDWGDSYICRVYEVLRDFGVTWAAAAVLLHDFGYPEFKMKGLAALFSANKDSIIRDRLRAVEMSRSAINAVLLDADNESYERKATSLAGYSDLIEKFMLRLSAAARMPVTKLMGQSPAGMNATGQSDTQNWDDQVETEQEEIQPQLEQMYKFLFLQKDGPAKGKEPDNWSLKFKPLRTPSEKEQADTRKTHSETDKTYYDMGVLSDKTIARSRFAGEKYGNDIKLTEDEVDALEPSKEELDMAMQDPSMLKPMGEIGAEGSAPPVPGGAEPIELPAMAESLMDIVKQAASGQIARESAAAIIEVTFGIGDPAKLERLLGPKNFEPKKQELPPGLVPPGGPGSSGRGKVPPGLAKGKTKPEDGATEEDAPVPPNFRH